MPTRPLHKLKIALATDWYLPRWGGAELGIHKLAKQLQARGHEVQVITTIPGPDEIDGVPVHRIPSRLFPKMKFALSPSIFGKIRKVLEREQFDVVHCHGSSVPPVAAGCVMLANRMRIPAVCTFRSLLGNYRIILKMTDWLLGWSDWPVVYAGNCEKVASELRDWIEPSKIHVLSNGLDPQEWRVPKETVPGEIHLTSIMRVTRRKRPKAFVNMIAQVRDRLPKSLRLRAWIVGDGPDRERIEGLIRGLGLEDAVRITGFLAKDEIKKIFSKTDIYVQPTIVEAFGNAALEARAAGLPVVARREGGIKEFIADGKEGFIAPDDAGMVDRIVELAADAELRERISSYNRQTSPSISWDSVLDRHLQIYHQAIQIVGEASLKKFVHQPSGQEAASYSSPLQRGTASLD